MPQCLDLEHSSGSAWLGASKVASCSEPAADETSGRFVVLHLRGGRAWIDVEALAKETGLKASVVRAELDRRRRWGLGIVIQLRLLGSFSVREPLVTRRTGRLRSVGDLRLVRSGLGEVGLGCSGGLEGLPLP